MRRITAFIMTLAILVLCVSGCSTKTQLDPTDPITLTMWHVYGEQADSPMNRLVDEFNRSVGKEKGIIIDVTMMSNSNQIGTKLLEAQSANPGAPQMPDLFFCHSNNALALGSDNLIDWYDYFSKKDLENYVPEFVDDGIADDKLLVFPVSKSTHLLFVAGGQFERFSKDTGVTYDSLETWEGFFEAAEKYYEWSGGKAFCAVDYLLRCVELDAISKGADDDFYTDDGWYDFENEAFKSSWTLFLQSLAKGHIVVSDMYSNTQVMTGDVACGIGSSASILYYNDTITYPDNTSEPTNLKVLALPYPKGGSPTMTQAGVGLCAYKTTPQKAEAGAVFAKWLTQSERNLSFVKETGYMPVNVDSFEKIEDYEFKNESYKSLYDALSVMKKNHTALPEPSFANYYAKVSSLYNSIRGVQKEWEARYLAGEDINVLTDEAWNILTSIN